MKKLIIIIFFFGFSNLYASEIKLEKIIDGLKKPWSFTFVNKTNILITEKSGIKSMFIFHILKIEITGRQVHQ